MASDDDILGSVDGAPIQQPAGGAGDVPPLGKRPRAPDGDVVFSAEMQRLCQVAEGDIEPPPDVLEMIERCSRCNYSDHGNMLRFNGLFGTDFVVRVEAEQRGGTVLMWDGRHWDASSGAAGMAICAGWISNFVRLEVRFIQPSDEQRSAMAAGDAAQADLDAIPESDTSDDAKARRKQLKVIIKAGTSARNSLFFRRQRCLDWADAMESSGHMDALQKLVMPHLRRKTEGFNADALAIATLTHTVRLRIVYDAECPDPDVNRVADVEIIAEPGHRRKDYITAVMPVKYDPDAKCPAFDRFIERFQPDEATRRCVMQFAGAGLTGRVVQRFALHYGKGANGKSVFLEIVSRVMGEGYSATLPNETVAGGAPRGNAGQATPDIMEMFGRRMVRVVELDQGQPINVSMIKRLCGGETMTGRPLFGGYVHFRPLTKVNLTANGEPVIEDSSNATWRRMLLFEWPVEIPEAEQREFEEVVEGYMVERDGILQRLLQGAVDYLKNGFLPAPTMTEQLDTYRGNMNWIEPYIRDCLVKTEGAWVLAESAYAAFVQYEYDAGNTPNTQTAFGIRMTKKGIGKRRSSDGYYYLDYTLRAGVKLADTILVNEYRLRRRKGS